MLGHTMGSAEVSEAPYRFRPVRPTLRGLSGPNLCYLVPYT